MYAAVLPFAAGTSLLLGSWYGLLAGVVLLALVVRRAVLEERTLQAELPGYDDYMRRVTYRLIPGIW
jgi:protein-S-isoprenylcysteine O-methyltransferase Ste14